MTAAAENDAEFTQAVQEFSGWVRRYVSYLGRLAAFMRDTVDARLEASAGLAVASVTPEDVRRRFAEFDGEVDDLYLDYIVIRRKYKNLLPARLIEARDTALGTLHGRVNVAVAGVRAAAAEFIDEPGFKDLPTSLQAQIRLLSEWTTDLQMEEFKDVYDHVPNANSPKM